MALMTKVAMKILRSALLLVFLLGSVFAQQTKYSDRCTVGLIDVTGMRSADLENESSRKLKPKELGSFDTVIYEEELTTKSYKLPKTRLYVIASVWYTDESMAGEDSQDSVSLQLTISPTPNEMFYRDSSLLKPRCSQRILRSRE
jgi:hypothetical protein